jgi:hypothetical protein
MSEAEKDRYLWDKQGEPDPEVQALERLLAPLGHDGRPLALPKRRPGRTIIILLAAAGLAAAAGLLVVWHRAPEEPGLPLTIASQGASLRTGEWLTTSDQQKLVLGDDLGRLTLGPGSRLQVKRLAQEETRLYLERGELDAFVSARARPRFFQVETPATTCVDLGCKYTLTVNDQGDSEVLVQTGRVTFESGAREVFIPAGARCRAVRGGGSGTPRFDDSPPALVAALDVFDTSRGALPETRRALAAKVLAAVPIPRHTLGPWHFLQDGDEEIQVAARARILELLGFTPAQVEEARKRKPRPDAADREELRQLLLRHWGTW